MSYNPNNPNGQQTMANSQPVTVASDQSPIPITSTQIGATNESAAGSDTATSGLNGLFKRALQHLTSLLGRFPSSIGQKAKTDSLSVTIANDQGNLQVADSAAGTKLDTVAANIGATNESSANETINSGLQGKIRYLIGLFRDLMGDKTEAVAASDTDARGLNGLIKRNNQNISKTNETLGDRTDAAATTDTGTHSSMALQKRYISRAPVAIDADNAALTNTKPMIGGGRAEDVESLPTFTAGDAVTFRFDKNNGGLIVEQGLSDSRYDTMSIAERTVGPSFEITRPNNTTGYTAGDVINQATAVDLAFADVSTGTSNDNDGGGYITSILLATNDSGAVGKTLSLHLYNGAFFNITNDNAPFNEQFGAVKFRVARVDLPVVQCVGSTDGECELRDLRIPYKLSGTNFNGQLITKQDFTPSANGTKFWIKIITTKN